MIAAVKKIQSWLYPNRCELCDAPSRYHFDICHSCIEDLPFNHHSCKRCAVPLTTTTQPLLCGRCQQLLPTYDNVYACFVYRFPIQPLITKFKFDGKLHYGSILSALFGDWVVRHQIPLPELIIPVPLHNKRIRERGFNQSLELARPLARRFNIPIDSGCCERTRQTPPQSALAKKERRKNVKGAFCVTQKPLPNHVVVLDDVITTGATISEISQVLKRCGVQKVDIWAIARTP